MGPDQEKTVFHADGDGQLDELKGTLEVILPNFSIRHEETEV